MNSEKLRAMNYKKVKVWPMAQPINPLGVKVEPRDDLWVVTSPFERVINLYNTVTGQNVSLGYDQVHEYRTDLGSSDGVLMLKCQIFTLWRGAFVRQLTFRQGTFS